MTKRIGASRYSNILLLSPMIPIILCLLFGPLFVKFHDIPATMDNGQEILGNIEKHYGEIQNLRCKKTFFQNCKRNNLIPTGFVLDFNLALGINDSFLVERINDIYRFKHQK